MLNGISLEAKFHRRVRSLASQRLGLRGTRIMQSLIQEPRSDFSDAVEDALVNGLITDEQETRIDATDIVFSALRQSDGSRVWVAVEASNILEENAVERAREAADALSAAFGQDAEAMVAGYRIDERDMGRAERLGVHAFLIPLPT